MYEKKVGGKLKQSVHEYVSTLIEALPLFVRHAVRLASSCVECLGLLAYGGSQLLAAALDTSVLFDLLKACSMCSELAATLDDGESVVSERCAVNCAVAVSAYVSSILGAVPAPTSNAAVSLRAACHNARLPQSLVGTLRASLPLLSGNEDYRRQVLTELVEALSLLCEAFAAHVGALLADDIFVSFVDVIQYCQFF